MALRFKMSILLTVSLQIMIFAFFTADNQFKVWIKSARVNNRDLRIAIKADQKTPYKVIKSVMNSLQDLNENRYNLITSLKNESAK